MILRPDMPYYPIPAGTRPQSTFGAIVEIILKVRMQLHLETCRKGYDEDVNAYLAGLLVSYIDPAYLTAISEAISKYDVDVHQAVVEAEDRVHAYWIYKVNADDLLVSLGIFHRLWHEAKGDVARLKCYYSYASEYQRRIYGRTTTVGQIQSELAKDSERYLSIFSGARRDYLHFIDHLRAEDLRELRRRLDQYAKEVPLKAKQDELLDAYSAWSKAPQDQALQGRLIRLAQELADLDPQFKPEFLLSKISACPPKP